MHIPTCRAQLLSIVKIYLFNLPNGFFCSLNDAVGISDGDGLPKLFQFDELINIIH